ncbi:MAG: hypothetical protein P0Y66_14845 [Candidatus Kaistia colombiensis]|nr:MAG: hypothetical protein P0Y66_14845 [Kaistia sp.]
MPEAATALLIPIATEVGVELLNSKGWLKNTQQLGADVIRTFNARGSL